MKAIRKLANEVIWLDKGELAMKGKRAVIEEYTRFLDLRDEDIAEEDV